MGVPPSGAFDMSESPHLTIVDLLRGKLEDFKSKSHGWMVK